MKNTTPNKIRRGCIDVWNSFMVEGAEFVLGSDIPICPCTATEPPKKMVSFTEAKHLHKIMIKDDPNYRIDAFVHFYIDDQKFDGPRDGIWNNPYKALEVISHFSGAISPDFSTNSDFPAPIKINNTYRMRAFGRWLTTMGIAVINNVRWGECETWNYCFDGIPYNSIVAIGTVASGIRKLENRPLFEKGLYKMVELINPRIIIVYGSANYSFFNRLSNTGIKIISFPSQTSLAFDTRKDGVNDE